MRKSIIAACDEAFLIGAEGRLPWNLPADMRLFRRLTMGKPVIMGRLTYESLGRPLPGRTNIVLSRRSDLALTGCTVAHDLDDAFARAEETGADECMVIGGGNVYTQAVWKVDRIYLTLIQKTFDVRLARDKVYFPRESWWDKRACKIARRIDHEVAADSPYAWSEFVIDLGPLAVAPPNPPRVERASSIPAPPPRFPARALAAG